MSKLKELNKKICEQIGIKKCTYEAMGEECEGDYPDLFEPNNFVKLIELQVSKKLIIGRYFQGSGNYGVPFSSQWYDRESFLTILIDYFSRTDECFAKNKNKIIHKIQQTEWEY